LDLTTLLTAAAAAAAADNYILNNNPLAPFFKGDFGFVNLDFHFLTTVDN